MSIKIFIKYKTEKMEKLGKMVDMEGMGGRVFMEMEVTAVKVETLNKKKPQRVHREEIKNRPLSKLRVRRFSGLFWPLFD